MYGSAVTGFGNDQGDIDMSLSIVNQNDYPVSFSNPGCFLEPLTVQKIIHYLTLEFSKNPGIN